MSSRIRKVTNPKEFFENLKNNPDEIIKWCKNEIEEYNKLIKLIKKLNKKI